MTAAEERRTPSILEHSARREWTASAMKTTSNQPARNIGRPSYKAADGVIVTDMALQPIALDSGAAAILSGEPVPGNGSFRLPPVILDALNARKPGNGSVVRGQFRIEGITYSCCMHLVQSCNSTGAEPMIAIILHKYFNVDDAVMAAAAEYSLTEREQEVFRGILMGETNKELAARMQRSPNTVKAFTRLIMIKMGVTTRAGLAGKLLNDDWRTL
jgi:DNA-binding CsgD family transcriptional regulator